jgi:hypothetical protein
MANLSGIVKQLEKERDSVERQLSGLNAALAAFAGVYSRTVKPGRKRRKMSVKARLTSPIVPSGSKFNKAHVSLLW